RLFALFGDHHRYSRFDDAGLFRSDFTQRVAEEIFVIEIDSGDDADLRRDDVGRIQAAAEPRFEHGEVDPSFGKIEKCDGGDALKKSRVRAQRAVSQQFFDERVDARKNFRERSIGNVV